MKLIQARTISDAHEKVVKYLFQEGQDGEIDLLTEDNEKTYESATPVLIHIDHPMDQPRVSPACMFDEKFLQEYTRSIMEATPKTGDKDFSYTYGRRLRDYPTYDDEHGIIMGDGCGGGIDQIMGIIRRLAHNANSRRAVAITWDPAWDPSSQEPPCLQYVQCMVRDSRLNMFCLFRSNDMLSAWGANAYALSTLQDWICDQFNQQAKRICRVGWLETQSISAHMYPLRDIMELNKFRAQGRY